MSATTFTLGGDTYAWDWVHTYGRIIGTADYIIDSIEPRFLTAQTEASPLVLDLDGNGISLVSLDSGHAVFWDNDQDGVLEKSAWIGSGDGFLALDLNNNGKIDNQSELFGTADQDGFSVLSQYDSNHDGVIDAADTIFASLKVWKDLNGNGSTDDGELFSLADLNIASISVQSQDSSQTIAGNRISATATYTLTDGTTRTVADAWFQYDNVVTQFAAPAGGYRLASLLLPELRGYGNLPSLSIATSESDSLFDMVKTLATQSTAQLFDPAFDLDGKFEDMLFAWAGVDGVAPDSRGYYIDARELAFLEVLTDSNYTQRGNPDPYVEASATLHNAFLDTYDAMLFRFLSQTSAADLINGIGTYDVMADEVSGTLSINFSKLHDLVGTWHYSGDQLVEAWADILRFVDGGIGLDHLTTSDITQLEGLIDQTDASGHLNYSDIVAAIFPQQGLGLNGTDGNDDLVGGAGDDDLDTGEGDDNLFGRAGNDSLEGGPGNDTLSGEDGDDTLQGDDGNDIYVYSTGLDTIRDSSGVDKILLPTGIALADLTFNYSPNNPYDLNIFRKGKLILIVENQFTTYGVVEAIQFADGSQLDLGHLAGIVQGDNSANILKGNDSPLFPHDRLYGFGGNDQLTGGLGDDTLYGGDGNDTYVVTSGFDTIDDDSGSDQVNFGNGYALSAMTYVRDGDDLFLQFNGVNAVRIVDQFSGDSTIETLHFADGQTVDLLAHAYTLNGSASGDYLYGISSGGAGDIINGLGGNDRIYGYDGDDTLDGGAGNDYVYGGYGNDTYLYSANSGIDTFADYTGNDRIVLGAGLLPSQLALERDSSDLVVSFNGVTAFVIDNQFTSSGQIETLQFADGSSLDLLSIAYPIVGTASGDYLYGISAGGNPDDVISGMGGNDTLLGNDGNDTLDGGDGNDDLYGGDGNDTYVASNGNDYVDETGDTGTDTIRLWAGISLSDIGFERYGSSDLLVRNAVSGATIQINDFFSSYYPSGDIENIVLGDGTPITGLATRQWTLNGTSSGDYLYGIQGSGNPDDIINGLGGNDSLHGLDGNDTLNGGDGNDSLYGGDGNDTYVASNGGDLIDESGDTGTDTIRLWAGVGLSGISFERYGQDDLLIHNTASGALIEIANYFSSYYPAGNIENIVLGDGTPITDLATRQWTLNGTSSGDYLEGVQGSGNPDDIINGLGGNDTIYGLAGNDTLNGGDGNDSLYGGDGNDTYIASNGGDLIDESGDTGTDTIRLWTGVGLSGISFERYGQDDLLIHNTASGALIEIANYFSDYYPTGNIENIVLGDGTAITGLATRQWTLNGTSSGDYLQGIQGGGNPDDIINGLGGNDTIYGLDGNDTLNGGDGNDSLYGGDGNDTYVASNGGDLINESGDTGTDTIRLWAGVGLSGISFERYGQDDLLIHNTASGALIEIANYFSSYYPAGNIENITLGDGTAITDLATRQWTMNGTSSGEYLYGIQGGGNPDDIINGLGGNDAIYAYAGNDRLDGGDGDDDLYGGDGNDTYIASNGNDYIDETGDSGTDTIRLWAGASLSGISFERYGQDDLLIRNTVSGATIDVNAYFSSYYPAGNIENIVLGDGTAITDLATRQWTLNGTSSSEYLYGIQGGGNPDDIINGLGGNDSLHGLDGNDRLDGGDGDDDLYGGDGNDTYIASNGNDYIDETGDSGTDTIRLWAGVGLSGISFERYGQDDLLIRNTVSGATIEVNAYFSSYYPAGDIENVTLGDGTAITDLTTRQWTVNGTSSSDYLYGIQGGGNPDDILNGLGGNDTLYGYDGNDWLDGGTGADSMYGGTGNDTFVVGNTNDYVGEYSGEGVDQVNATISYTLPTYVEVLRLMAPGLTGTGNGYDNILEGSSGDDILNGGAGSDYASYEHAAAAVTVSLGLQNQAQNTGAAGMDTLTAFENLIGSAFADGLTGDAGNNKLLGLAGNDTLAGLDGNDYIDGGAGADTMTGGLGDDTYVVDSLADVVNELAGQGTDTVQSAIGYTLQGTVENLTLTGSADINGTGNSLVNVITGNTGANRLDGGGGSDTLAGGLGGDTYIINNGGIVVVEKSGEGNDTVLASVDYTLASNVENLVLAGTANLAGTGNGSANTLTGNSGNNALAGGGGDDVIVAGAGNDAIDGGSGNDTVDYASDTAGITASLAKGTLTGTAAGSDTLANIENLNTGSGIDMLTGSLYDNVFNSGAGNDTLSGMAGNDVLNGGAGLDKMLGGAGNDTYYVDNAGDIVSEETVAGIDDGGTDTVRTALAYTLGAHIENLILSGSGNIAGTGNSLVNALTGNDGNNTLRGMDGNDTLSGGGGNDTLIGGAGADRMIGGAGNDTYLVDDAGDRVSEQTVAGVDDGGNDTVQSYIGFHLGAGLENLALLGGAMVNATGNELNNVLTGNSNDNVINGMAGADTMSGGGGNDTYFVDDTGDVVIENANAGAKDKVISSIAYTLTDNVENLTVTGTGDFTVTGNGLGNILVGNAGNNLVDGSGGGDHMFGGAGNDTYIVDNDYDRVSEQLTGSADDGGVDTVMASVTYHIFSFVENLTLTGTADINATGNQWNNVLVGNSGNNVLNGQIGADTMSGGAGNDGYIVDNIKDVVIEKANEGTDKVLSSVSYTLSANVENIALTGTANINATGNSLDNVMTGNDGNNILIGGAGHDNLIGGGGADIFRFGLGSGADIIKDFHASDNDRIDISAYTHGTANTALIQQSGVNTIIDLGAGNIITLLNAAQADVASHVLW